APTTHDEPFARDSVLLVWSDAAPVARLEATLQHLDPRQARDDCLQLVVGHVAERGPEIRALQPHLPRANVACARFAGQRRVSERAPRAGRKALDRDTLPLPRGTEPRPPCV